MIKARLSLVAVLAVAASAYVGAGTAGAATVAPDPSSTSYQQGSADRDTWETWFNSLNGSERDGADFGAGQRSLRAPVPCSAPASYGDDWLSGCTEAKRRLAPADIKRMNDPQYWNGWNTIGTTPTAEHGQSRDFEHPSPGWLGVHIQRVTPELADSVGLKDARGAMVTAVVSGGAAEKAHIHGGDVILRFDGQDVKDMQALPRIVTKTAVGKQ